MELGSVVDLIIVKRKKKNKMKRHPGCGSDHKMVVGIFIRKGRTMKRKQEAGKRVTKN